MGMSLQLRYTTVIVAIVISLTVTLASALIYQFSDGMRAINTATGEAISDTVRTMSRRRGEDMVRMLGDNLVNPLYLYDMESMGQVLRIVQAR